MGARQRKIEELLRKEISDILLREFKDPRLGFITITDTEVSTDIKFAKVFVSVYGNQEEQEKQFAILKNAERFIRGAFGKRIRMKTLPEIEFKLDTSAERGVRIMELLEEIKHDETEEPS